MRRAYYENDVSAFLADDETRILGELSKQHSFALEGLQKVAWIAQIQILKNQLAQFSGGYLAFEYSIPRMGKRVDVVLLRAGIVFVLEFKVGASSYSTADISQTLDYALDLKNFHAESHERRIVPILIATSAMKPKLEEREYDDRVTVPQCTNGDGIERLVLDHSSRYQEVPLDPKRWMNSIYRPTPTIIEAAQALYKGHSVDEISRSDSDVINLGRTSTAIHNIIEDAKTNKRKAICFVTGVPGSGKTLAGLNIANSRHNVDEGEHAVFLSGNGPLVEVLQEALARNERDESRGTKAPVTKSDALRRAKAFIQNIHHFRDSGLASEAAPVERVAIFDEAQRAWDREQTTKFMVAKKGVLDFDQSEPEFLISLLDRHDDWAVIVCLIGGGQEIHKGEAGLPGWFEALASKYPDWDIHVSSRLTDDEYTVGQDLYSMISTRKLKPQDDLHLSVSIRSYRSEKLAAFVKALLDLDIRLTRSLLDEIGSAYPIVLTRDLDTARNWLRGMRRGTERAGISASSNAYRLKPHGIHVKAKITPANWFLNPAEDVRSSDHLEDVATEFDIQGLELDWACVAWGADLRLVDGKWAFHRFRGTRWQQIKKSAHRRYLLNAYRVLLTRARQGMVIYVPPGDEQDETRPPNYYDPLASHLKGAGIRSLDTGETMP